jgi:diguanylate cyclase (GGDEF)-like protein
MSLVASTLVAPTIGAVVMAVLLLGFFRQYGKSYLQHWMLASTALAVYHVASRIEHPAARWIAGLTSLLPIAWLLFGVYELIRRRPIRMVRAHRILAGVALAGLAISLALPAQAATIRAAVTAMAGAAAAVVLWRSRRKSSGIGFIVLAAAFIAYAIEQMFASTWAELAMGVGMIACLLEDERETAELAAQEIEHLAYHDPLTGLPNRPLFIDRLIVALAQASRDGQKLAVLFLDVDRFKDVNDSLGHTSGDALLKAVASRVRNSVREGDTVARFGGDEFTLLIPKIDQVDDVAKIAQKIIEALRVPFQLHEQDLFVSASIGVSIYPADGHDPETLVRNADTAMYRAKEQGRDSYQLYAPAMNARALERLALENLLRRAVEHDELVLHYQPLIDTKSRAITGVEALVRWRHPELGLLLPAQFISVAEVSGVILPIGEWILRTACAQVREWQRRHESLMMSVNLSARQFQQPDLVDQVRRALEESGVEPWRLQLEITESHAMQNTESSIFTLRELKELGVRIAMDDFGTGYSSLNYLKRFPIDTLKLDQSFIRDITTDPADAAIVSAVIAMAHSLSIEVVAEGVETKEQLEFLARQNCDVIQGFLFSAPMPAEELVRFLTAPIRA